MRVLVPVLVALALSATLPVASAHHGRPAGCDYDDDLYNHCHVGDLYWVTGPGCFGVRYGEPATCHPLLDPN